MGIKIFYLSFLFLICLGCSDHIQEKALLLSQEIAQTPICSARFDSLLHDVYELPLDQRIECIIQISYRKEKTDGIFKQEKLLRKELDTAPRNRRKEILLRLVNIYNQQDQITVLASRLNGLQCIEKLEKDYYLSQEEKWNLSKIKTYFLDAHGKQEEYLPIWFHLLKEHRIANRSELIIEDLYKIASYFKLLGDYESAITLYKEAYQLSVKKKIPEYTNKCLRLLSALLYEDKQYQEAINYCQYIIPQNNILADCYLALNMPDSARSVLSAKISSKNNNNILLNLQLAETYILEEKEDSASSFLNKALEAFQVQKLPHKQNKKATLPTNFLKTYPLYAELLQKHGKTKQASEAYQLIEPLMRTNIETLNWKERQINAITSYSNFCRTTRQYEKALELLASRDSLQLVYNSLKEEQDKENLVHRFEVGELKHKIDMQDVELTHSKTLNVFLICAGSIGLLLLTMIGLLFRERKKQFLKLYQQYEQLHKLDENPVMQQEAPDPTKALFMRIKKSVLEDKLFLKSDLTVESLADLLNSNRTYISSCVNECANCSFSSWVNDLRIKYAVKLMHDDTSLDTKKLAQQCGFTTNETFYKNFKQRCGVKPSQYLDQIILEKEKK